MRYNLAAKSCFHVFFSTFFPGEKVGVGKICLWCNERGKSFYSTEAVQAHMNDRSHCKLFTDGDALLEFADFYDFRSVWFVTWSESNASHLHWIHLCPSLVTVSGSVGYPILNTS